MKSEAKVTTVTTTLASIEDDSLEGLTVGHLKAFLHQAELAGLGDKTPVHVSTDTGSQAWERVHIRATNVKTTGYEIPEEVESTDANDR